MLGMKVSHLFLKSALPGFFYLLSSFLQTVNNCSIKVTEFEPGSSGIGCDHAANCATTAAQSVSHFNIEIDSFKVRSGTASTCWSSPLSWSASSWCRPSQSGKSFSSKRSTHVEKPKPSMVLSKSQVGLQVAILIFNFLRQQMDYLYPLIGLVSLLTLRMCKIYYMPQIMNRNQEKIAP